MKVIYLLPVFSLFWIEVSSNIDITPIHSSPGLYYEQVGEVSLSNNNWEFVTYVNYSGYLLFYKYLHVQAEKLHKFCQVTQQELCTQKYDALKLSLNAIDEEDETMANYLGVKKPRRRKRFWGLIAGIAGSLFGSIFGGGSSSPDMSKYDQAIGSLQQGQAEIMNQMQMQATMFTIDSERKNMQLQWLNRTQGEIKEQMGALTKDFLKDSAEKAQQIKNLNEMLDETNNKLKKHAETQKKLVEDVTKIKDKLVSVDKQLTHLNNKIEENTASINQTNLNLIIVSISSDFHLLLSRFEREQTKLFNAIVKAKKAKEGELDPYVLSPLNLIEMLQGIIPNLKENEKFPFYPNVENAHLLYNLIQPDVFLSNDALIFVLKLPLIHFKKFNLFKITTVPIHVTNQLFTFVLPQEPYLLIDKELEQEYMLLPFHDFKTTCSQVKKIDYICKQTQFLRQVQGSNDCEIKLFTSTTLPKSCDTRLMKLNTAMFIQLQKRNSWLYAAPEKTKDVIINCGTTERNIVSLIGTGFMNIKEDCNVRVENNPLISLMEYTKPVVSNYTSAVNLLDFIILPKTENLKLSSKNPKETLLPFEFDSLKEVSIAIETIEEENNLLYWLIPIPIAFLAALIFLAYKMHKNHKRLKEYFRNRSARNAAKNDNSIQDRLRMKVKMRDNNEKIKRVSMKEEPSDDPDAEYLTVRFKVEKNLMNNAVPSPSKEKEPSPTVLTKNFDNLFVDKCSKNLNANKEKNFDTEKSVDKNDDYITMKRPLPVVPGDGNDEEASEIVYGNVEKSDDSNDEDSEYGNVIGPKNEDAYLNELRKLKLAKLRAMKPKGGLKLEQVTTNLNIIAENERITSSLLGLDPHPRSKRSWAQLVQVGMEFLPYFLRPLGDKFASFVYGERQSGPDMEMYEQQLQELSNGQNEVRNLVYEHATMFKADSELKTNQIEELNRANDDTKNQLRMLRETAEADSKEKAQKIKDLQELLDMNTKELKQQEEMVKQHSRDIDSFKNFIANMTTFTHYLDAVSKDNMKQINKVKGLAQLNSMMSDFNFIFSNYIRDQEQLLQIVEKANKGAVDPRVITPMKLMSLMQEAGAHLPEGSTFPYHPSLQNSMKLYRLIEPIVYRYNYTIVFKFRMKLVQLKKFSLFKITTVPIQIGSGKFVFVLPKNPFLIVDKAEAEYATITESRYRTSCIAASTTQYICTSIITESTAGNNLPCDVGIFLEKNITSKCDVRLMHLDYPIFLQLMQRNSWIYVTPNAQTIIFKSGSFRTPETLDGVGVLSLGNETAVLGTIVLSYTPDTVYFEVSQLHSPTLSLLNFVDKSNLPELDEETLNAKPKKIILPFEYRDLEECSVRIRGNADGAGESKGDLFQFVIIGIVVIGTVILVMLIMFKNNYFHCPFRKFDDETNVVKYCNVKA